MTNEPQDPLDQALDDLVAAFESMTDDELRQEATSLNQSAGQAFHPARARALGAMSRIAAGVVHRRTDAPFQDIADHEDPDYT